MKPFDPTSQAKGKDRPCTQLSYERTLSNDWLPTAHCLLLTTHSILPTAYCLLLSAFCLLLSAFLVSASAQTRWTPQRSGTLAWLHAVYFLDQNQG